jgi:excinuclease ABC subunit C
LFLPGGDPIRLDRQDPVLYFVQRLRDEAHRFAIGTHRARRAKTIEKSPLDEIPSVGAARKKALLHHFGSARAVSQAGLADLEAVEGVSKGLAKRIYDWFHPEG